MMKRMDFLIDGERKLKELLDVLKSCNDGLLQIAPPAPDYYNLGADQILSTSEFPAQVQVPENHSSSPSLAAASVQDQDRLQATSSPPRGRMEEYAALRLIHSRCTETLQSIIAQDIDHRLDLENAVGRLAVWASGMFTGRITLDQVLCAKSYAQKMIRDQILGILVDIAIFLGKLCRLSSIPAVSCMILHTASMHCSHC